MRKTLKVRVTKEDIEKGQRADCHRCPVALAMKRALKMQGHRVSVGNSHIRWTHDGVRWTWQTTGQIKQFITDFDVPGIGRENISPFSFEIPLKEVKRA